MTPEDIQMLVNWLNENRDHRLSFIEKEAVKAALRNAKTVGDLADLALKLLRHGA